MVMIAEKIRFIILPYTSIFQ